MANDDVIRARGGLLPVQYPFGAFKKSYYRLTTGVAAANIFIGMPVDLDTNGRAVPWAGPVANLSLLGTIVGFADTDGAALPSAMETTTAGAFLPGNTDAYVMIADDPNQEFFLQEDTGGAVLTEASIGNTFDLIYRSSSGDTTTGYATVELDRSTAGTGTGGIVQLVNLGRNMNSDGTINSFGNFAKCVVRIARHRNSNAAATAQGGNPI